MKQLKTRHLAKEDNDELLWNFFAFFGKFQGNSHFFLKNIHFSREFFKEDNGALQYSREIRICTFIPGLFLSTWPKKAMAISLEKAGKYWHF